MREAIDRVIESGQYSALAELLEDACAKDVHYVAKRIVSSRQKDGGLLSDARDWAGHSEVACRLLACSLIRGSYAEDPSRAVSVLRGLAKDSDWTVGEAAGTACGTLLQEDFEAMVEVLREWRKDSSYRLRRTVAVAAAKAARSQRLEWAEPLLKLLEPLLEDRHPSVRRNIGPAALGNVFLDRYRDITFEYLVKWSTSNDEQVLWNVAMAFSSSAAAPLAKKGLIVLRKLSLDERRYVWRAVSSAMWKLGRKRPEVIRPELASWLEDERRVEVARQALKYL